jgi:hypothetical protein
MIDSPGRRLGNHTRQTHRATLGNKYALHAGRFGRPENSPEVMRIFDTVKQDQQRSLPGRLRHRKNVIRLDIGLGRHKSDDSLMSTSWDKSIESRAWFEMHRDSLCSCQADDFTKLPIGSQNEKTLEWTNACPQGLAHGMEAVDYLRRVIVSIDWCHPDGPQS